MDTTENQAYSLPSVLQSNTRSYLFVYFFLNNQNYFWRFMFFSAFFYYTSSPPFTTSWNPLFETTTRTKSVHVREQPPCQALITDVKWIANEPTVTGRFPNRCFSCFYHEHTRFLSVSCDSSGTQAFADTVPGWFIPKEYYTQYDEATQEENYS